jgi:hypothetical protein
MELTRLRSALDAAEFWDAPVSAPEPGMNCWGMDADMLFEAREGERYHVVVRSIPGPFVEIGSLMRNLTPY